MSLRAWKEWLAAVPKEWHTDSIDSFPESLKWVRKLDFINRDVKKFGKSFQSVKLKHDALAHY